MNFIRYKAATRIGNWLFQIAFARLLGSAPIAFYVRPEVSTSLLEQFGELYPDISFTHNLPQGIVVFEEETLCANDFRLPAERDNLLLDGYFQFPQLFSRKELITQFQCPVRIMSVIKEKYAAPLSSPLAVGISVRRGDYLRLPHRHPFVGRSYLSKAVFSFPDDSTFLVCSDDIQWCKAFFTENRFPGRRFVLVEGEEVLTQLFLQTMCHHNIISNSSFSWWGAYLNPHDNAIAVFPSMWYGMQKPEIGNYLYYPEAKIIHNRYGLCQWLHAVALCGKTGLGRVLRSLGVYTPSVRERIPGSFLR